MQSVIFDYRKALKRRGTLKMLMACVNTIASDQFAHLVGLKKSLCGSHTLCVDHEEPSGMK